MDNPTLVDVDIAAGKQVLQILDQAGFKVIAAFWLYTSEFEAWRLYIASPVVDAEGRVWRRGRQFAMWIHPLNRHSLGAALPAISLDGVSPE